ncbi:hypothetical protein WMF31_41920 [Sorangium sp. So ce1036]|uniref:hypothetical protein n=1 Tax=Sorangium sp. So ce1036 TaxID=3133328 RepID=UPI003F006E32
MNQEISRLGCVLKYRIMSDSYIEKRSFLCSKAWAIAAAAASERFYCEFFTFPGWTSPDDMLDFGRVWRRFPLTDYSALCVQINSSPIDDTLGDSVFDLLPEMLLEQVRADLPRIACLDDAPHGDWPRSMKSVLDTPLPRLLDGIVLDRSVESCALIYGDVNYETDAIVCEPSRMVAILMLHLALQCHEPLLVVSARQDGSSG